MASNRKIRLAPYTADSPRLEDALRVYARVWPDRDAAETREGFTRYATYTDFVGLVAYRDDEAVGIGYGARSQAGVPWHDLMAPLLGNDHPALQETWRLVELAVDPDYQGYGIGGQLHDALIRAQPCPRVVLSTSATNQRARSMYERRGWTYIESSLHIPGHSEPYAIMGKETR